MSDSLSGSTRFTGSVRVKHRVHSESVWLLVSWSCPSILFFVFLLEKGSSWMNKVLKKKIKSKKFTLTDLAEYQHTALRKRAQ